MVDCEESACFVSYLPFEFHPHKYFPTVSKHLQTEKSNRNDMSVLCKRRMNTGELVSSLERLKSLECWSMNRMNFPEPNEPSATHIYTNAAFSNVRSYLEKRRIDDTHPHSFRTSTPFDS